ncbi:MAG: hypothetical protein AAB019_11295 [Planctomycetota bacterium]
MKTRMVKTAGYIFLSLWCLGLAINSCSQTPAVSGNKTEETQFQETQKEQEYQKWMSEARNLIEAKETNDALNAIDNALKIKPNDPTALELKKKCAAIIESQPNRDSPAPEGFTAIGKNTQGYEEYRHEATGMVFVLDSRWHIPDGL